LAFLDEDELAPAEPGARRYGDRQRQYLVRRVVALAAGILILVLILLGIRGCLNARKERGFENYVSDVNSIVTQSNQLSKTFFAQLEGSSGSSGNQATSGSDGRLELQAEVAADRGTAEGLLKQVQNLDTPDELKGAHDELEQAFELRRDGLADIADEIPTALGTAGRTKAIEAIANDMKTFLASDVLYRRSQEATQAVLEDEGIEGDVQASVFLPDPVDQWLDPLEIGSTLATAAGESGATQGVHGLALLSTTVNPAGVALVADSPNTVTLQGKPELEVEVQNQGDSEESDVVVNYRLTGGAEVIEGDTTIPKIASQGVETATLGFESELPTDTELTLEVTVQPVLGEEISDNNTATYQVTFQ
jgi:hypothetical protein